MIDPSDFSVGDRVRFVTATGSQWRATVDRLTENYVALNWGLKPFSARNDIILKTSPLWQLLELVK
jgi:hypothetical protein